MQSFVELDILNTELYHEHLSQKCVNTLVSCLRQRTFCGLGFLKCRQEARWRSEHLMRFISNCTSQNHCSGFS